jgi:4-amino-4-deoxy-L-arabinose transferase-like glycosyltransferase
MRRPATRPGAPRWVALLALVAVAGVVLRVWIYRSVLGVPNSDEAVVGLMVLHALRGDVSMFFWGSPYGGPQEVLLSVPFFWVLGSGYLALRLVPILLNALACLLVFRVGRRTVGEPAARTAAALLWLWPPFNLFQLTQQQSFYAANVVYCALVLLLALRLAERPSPLRAALLGFTIGFGFWETPQIVPIAAPAVCWCVWRERAVLRHALPGAAATVAGASPWIVWNALHGFASLAIHSDAHLYLRSLRLFASPILPMTLGLRTPFTQQLLVPSAAAIYLVYAGLLAAFALGAYRTRTRPAFLLFVVAALFPLVYALDRRTTFFTSWPQYTVVVTPVVVLLVAQVATRYGRAVAVLALALAITAVSIPRMIDYYHVPQPVPRAPRDLAPLVAELDRLGVRRAFADYWIAYLVDFATKERIVAVEPGPHPRYRPYERAVSSSPHGYVFFRRTAPARLVAALVGRGYGRHEVGPFLVLAPPPRGRR